MWRLAPTPGIVVSLKRNPGRRTHAACGNHGYRNLPGARATPAAVVPGTTHTLAAVLAGGTLRVWADGAPAWEGVVDAETLALDGPAGVRSDNGRFDIELHARGTGVTASVCASNSDDE